jgi:hypothetical protein
MKQKLVLNKIPPVEIGIPLKDMRIIIAHLMNNNLNYKNASAKTLLNRIVKDLESKVKNHDPKIHPSLLYESSHYESLNIIAWSLTQYIIKMDKAKFDYEKAMRSHSEKAELSYKDHRMKVINR